MTTRDELQAAIRESARRRSTDILEPQPMQVWSATWNRVRIPVMLERVRETTAWAVPVTGDPEFVIAAQAILSESESPLGYEAAVWDSPHVELPLVTLDRCYGTVDPAELEDAETPTELTGAARRADPRFRQFDAVVAELEVLASATWIPDAVAPVGALDGAMTQAHATLRNLRDRIGLGTQQTTELRDHGWWLTRDQVAAACELLDVPELPEGDPLNSRPALRKVLEWPQWRQKYVDYRRRHRTSEAGARFLAATSVLAGARARAVPGADQSTQYWEELIDDALNQ